jgi:hypothetical protein
MMGRKDDRPAGKSGHRGFPGTILAALALGAIFCAAPVLAQTVSPAQEPAPTEAAAAAGPGAVAEPTVALPKSPPRIDALLPSALPRDLSPWGMFLGAVPLVKIVMVGLAFASLVTWTVWLAKTIELWNARRAARQGLEVLARAKSLRAAEKEFSQTASPVARFVAAAAGEADRSDRLAPEGVKDRAASLLSRMTTRQLNAHGGAISLLVWEAIQDALQRGLIFDFDGMTRPEGSLFYTEFGGRRPRAMW